MQKKNIKGIIIYIWKPQQCWWVRWCTPSPVGRFCWTSVVVFVGAVRNESDQKTLKADLWSRPVNREPPWTPTRN